MPDVDFSDMRPVPRKPTRRERGRYHAWVKYLKDSKLTVDEIHSRAATLAKSGFNVPKD